MSYSVCLDCKEMVSGYEKYCRGCATKYRTNDKYFWKNNGYAVLQDPLRSDELDKDRVKEWDEIASEEIKK